MAVGNRGGRPRKPTALKILQGTLRKDRTNPDEPRPEVGLLPCPRYLDDEAKREWKRLAPQLYALGLLTKLDKAALAVYCQAWSHWVEAERHLHEEGHLISTPNGFQQPSHWLGIASKAIAQIRAMAVEFGLTPASRSRLSVAPPSAVTPAHPNKLARYLTSAEREDRKRLLFGTDEE